MTFQTLDDKQECRGVFYNGDFYFNELPRNLDRTWAWSSHLEDYDIEFAEIWMVVKILERFVLSIFLIVIIFGSNVFKHTLKQLFNRKSTWMIIAFIALFLGMYCGTFIS